MSHIRLLKTVSLFIVVTALLIGSSPPSASAQLDSLPQYRYVRLTHADTTLYMFDEVAQVNEDGVVLFSNPFLLRGSAIEQFQPPFFASVWVDGTLVPVHTGTDYEQAAIARWNAPGQIVTSAYINYPERLHIHPLLTSLGQTPGELELLPKTHHEDPDFPYPPCLNAYATDINDNGAILGHAREGTNYYVDVERFLVLWNGGGPPMKLPAPDGIPPADFDHHHQELFINNNGTIAGTRWIQSSLAIGFYGNAGSLASIPYGRDSLIQAHVLGLGDNDWAIGTMQGKWERPSDGVWVNQTHGWVSKDGQTMIDLNNSDTANQSSGIFPQDVNSDGLIVGSVGLSWNGAQGVLWREENGQFVGYGLTERVIEGNGDIPFGRISGGLSIADNGIILAYTLSGSGFSFPGLLIPTDLDLDNGFCVNTDSDQSDANPGDGICSTGELNSIGVPYCSMRAAIEESNAHAGVDTICFDIPLNRTIYPQTPLPAITDPVVIDGSTQPGGPPHLNGQQQGFGSGLEILAGGSTVLNIMLNQFASDGMELRIGDGNTIESCWFGTDQTDTVNLGNGGHGIYIENSSQNKIGRPGALERANTLAWNGQAGVFVQSGDQNTIFTNRFFFNNGLAIDLAPAGVNNNDDDDIDAGPNTLLNHPVIDRVENGYLYGTINGEPNELIVVELYRSDSAHPSGYGEGREPLLLTTTVNTDGDGNGTIELFLDGETLADAQVFTLLAHDADNTSEFSPAWPNKRIRVTDHAGAPIPSMSFEMFRIDGGPPDFAETLLDTITTDADGYVEMTDYFFNGDLGGGSVIKLTRFMVSEPTVRANPGPLPDAIEWHLDNAGFDENTYAMGFDTLDASGEQEIRMDHTLILFNLFVSIEWEVEQDYVDRLEQALREGSNYLFDISDGQMALGKIHIVDDKENWQRADLRILAENTFEAESKLDGVRTAGPWYMVTSRRWFGNGAFGPDSSFNEFPLNPAGYKNVRVIIHEIGHYFMALADEYEFYKFDRCSEGKLYGFMDLYYDLQRPETSEMSRDTDYVLPGCQNTNQWREHNQSCWETVDASFTRTEDGVMLPIYRPDERPLAPGFDYFAGPNNNLGSPDYDIGARLETTRSILPNSSGTHFMYFDDPTSGQPLSYNFATLLKTVKGPFKRRQKQGRTARSGWLQVLGAENGDSIELQGQFTEFITGSATAGLAVNPFQWASARAELNLASDSQTVSVTPILGNFPLLCAAELTADSVRLTLDALNLFSSNPGAVVFTDSGSSAPIALTPTANTYSATLPDSLLRGGTVQVSAVDDTGASFFFNIDYTRSDSATGGFGEILSAGQQFRIALDSAQGDFAQAMILSTDFPPPVGNLPTASRAVSRTHSLALTPDLPFAESTLVTIGYNEAAVGNDSGLYGNEVSVHVYKWDDNTSDWEMLPNIIDTTHNIVMARVTSAGTYAAFTSDINTDVIHVDDDLLPGSFQLSQNYPNPFNPSTSIEYSLPTASHVELTIHNLLGQRVTTLVAEHQAAGRYIVTWDGTNTGGHTVASGVYFYRIMGDGFEASRKMILLK